MKKRYENAIKGNFKNGELPRNGNDKQNESPISRVRTTYKHPIVELERRTSQGALGSFMKEGSIKQF